MKQTILIQFLLLCFAVAPGYSQLTLAWSDDTSFRGPESVVYDKINNCLYVSNFGRFPKEGENYNDDYVSKVSPDGKVIAEKFITHLTCPTGLCLYNGKLLIVERFGVVQFDLKTETTETRYFIYSPGFINDISVDSAGAMYVTDSQKESIYRIMDHKVERWLESSELSGINGILADGNRLIVGITGDSSLKAVNLADRKIARIAQFPKGTVDGIKKLEDDYLVSLYEGTLYCVHPDGSYKELLNTRAANTFCADFEYIEEQKLFVIPTLFNDKLIAYRKKD